MGLAPETEAPLSHRGGAGSASPSPGAAGAWPAAWPLLVFAAFAAIDLAVYRESLQGPFLSDDIGYIASPYTRELGVASLIGMFDPFGAANLYTANYAPVHLLLVAVERNIFAGDVLGYHLVNLALHALNATLLVALLLRSGLPRAAALVGGLLFTLHPANVEAVAWISQSKTTLSLAFSLGALLLLARRPGAATALFALGLLTKASAAFALPMAAVSVWAGGFAAGPRSGRWLGMWALLLGLFAIPQFASFGATGAVAVPAYEDPLVHLRTVAGIGARYLAMAVSSYGVSAFAEPDPAYSPLDAWWLGALVAFAAIVWRLVVVTRRRSEETAWWVAAAAAFVPVSQVFPFLIPVADRYLYFIAPGLIGAALFAVGDLGRRAGAGSGARRIALTAAAALAVFFAVHSHARARLWTNETLLYLDAARHFPDGATAAFFEARRAAQAGDPTAAVAALRRAAERGVDGFMTVRDDPGLAPIRDSPEFRALVVELAGLWIERAAARANPSPPELRATAFAHIERGELAAAEELLERALAQGGPLTPALEGDLAALRRRGDPGGAGSR